MPASVPESVDGHYVNVLTKIINDVSDEKERFGKRLIDNEREIGALLIDIFSHVKGESRRLSISGADVWLAYRPYTVNITPVSDAAEGEPPYRVSTSGQVVLHHLSERGQYYREILKEGMHHSHFSRLDEQKVLSLSADDPRLRHLLQKPNFNINNIQLDLEYQIGGYRYGADGQDVHRQLNQQVYQYTSLLDDDTFESPIGDLAKNPDDMSANRIRLKDTLNAIVQGDGENVVPASISVNSLHGSQDRNLILGLLTDQYFSVAPKELKDAIVNVVEMGERHVVDEVKRRVSARVDGLVPNVKPEMERLMIGPIRNFISDGVTEANRKFRYQFIEQLQHLMFGSIDQDRVKPKDMAGLLSTLISHKHGETTDQEIIKSIDEGQFPARLIVSNFGFPNMSKKQFARALSIMGEQTKSMGFHPNRGVEERHPLRKMVDHTGNIKSCFAMACLPKEWMQWTPGGKDILNTRDLLDIAREKALYTIQEKERLMGTGMSSDFDSDYDGIYANVASMFETMRPTLINTAVKMDTLRGVINNASSPEAARDAKQKMKLLVAKWSWLAAGDASMSEKVERFDEQFKVSASFSDYSRLMGEFIDTVNRRVLISNPNLPDSVFMFDRENIELDYRGEEIETAIFKHLDEEAQMEEPEQVWDEDLEEYVTMENDELPSQYMGRLHIPGGHNAVMDIKKSSDNFKEIAHLNNELHKYHGKIIREANRNTSHNITWQKLTDSPLRLGDYIIDTIDNRLDLLLEGSEMDHCAFSYMNACMNGDSVIMSARHAETGERVATIELLPEYDENDNGEITATYEIEQCFGHRNIRTEGARKVERLMSEWVAEVNNGHVPTNAAKMREPDDERMNDIFDEVYDNPEKNGDKVCTLPFTGDAAYLAYYAFNQYSPEGYNFERLVSDNELFSEIYYGSAFSQEIRQIDALCKAHHIEPASFILHKMRYNVENIDNVPAHMEQHQRIISKLDVVMQEYGDTLSGGQLVKRCGDVLSEFGMTLSDDVDASVLSRPDGLDALMEHAKCEVKSPALDAAPEDVGQRYSPKAARLAM